MRPVETWGLAALACMLAMGAVGCGTPAAPQPPSLNLPDRVTDLFAVRAGGQVALTWTMPKRNTDKLLLREPVTVRVCRQDGVGPCVDAGAPLKLAPAAHGTFVDTLPAAQIAGAARAMSYFVELKNRKDRSAGFSNAAAVVAGASPEPVAGLSAEVRKAGVVLHWTASGDEAAVRLQRTLLTPPKTDRPKEGLLTPPREALEQNLLIENVRDGTALDKSIRFGEVYSYRAQRVSRVEVDGKTVELASDLSDPVRVEAKDVFPPAVPSGLAAVATVGEAGVETAIDLSWLPDTEPDLAGYVVYRREGDGTWQRISPAAPVVGPAFHDTTAQPGHTYVYAVSAVDQSGHESARSAEAQESVPSS
ncbi:MAG TPA: fibronectin type III domain-containing protein [Terracidiphilus sp.]|jgi:hypothetical protein|nr:fibronectin type III domain-containing protein [Terracidiphilus sp.]